MTLWTKQVVLKNMEVENKTIPGPKWRPILLLKSMEAGNIFLTLCISPSLSDVDPVLYHHMVSLGCNELRISNTGTSSGPTLEMVENSNILLCFLKQPKHVKS